MRRNAFGEAYCHTADEVRQILDEKGWEVYVSESSLEEPAAGDKATAEILENESGDTVCYIEADTVEEINALITELKLEKN